MPMIVTTTDGSEVTQETQSSIHELDIAGIPFSLAATPEAVLTAGAGEWFFPSHWPSDPLHALSVAWQRLSVLVFDTGCVLFEDLGDGSRRLIANLGSGDASASYKVAAAIAYQFCATDCTRIRTTADAVTSLEPFACIGLAHCGVENLPCPDGSTVQRHHFSVGLDEWASIFGARMLLVEGLRFGNEEKVAKCLRRIALFNGDTSALELMGGDMDIRKERAIARAMLRAARAGFELKPGTTHWVEGEANEESGWPAVVISNGTEIAHVDACGEVSITQVS